MRQRSIQATTYIGNMCQVLLGDKECPTLIYDHVLLASNVGQKCVWHQRFCNDARLRSGFPCSAAIMR
eukprot:548785-Amphidinium_carterae.1